MFHPRSRSVRTLAVLMALTVGLIACTPKTPQDKLAEAQKLFMDRSIPLAILKIKGIIKDHPEDPIVIDSQLALGQIYLQLGRKDDLENAITAFRAVVNKVGFSDQRGIEAHQVITQLHMQLEDFDKALENATAAEVLAKNDPALLKQVKLAKALLLLDAKTPERQTEGADSLRKMMLEDEDAAERGAAREQLANHFRRQQKLDEADKVYEEFAAKFPEDSIIPQLRMMQALGLRGRGKESEARPLFEANAALVGAQIDAELDLNARTKMLYDMARYREEMGDLDKSEGLLMRIMKERTMTEEAVRAQLLIATMYARKDKLDEAQTRFEQIKRENPRAALSDMPISIAEYATSVLDGIAKRRTQLAELAKGDGTTTGTLKTAATATTETLRIAPAVAP